MDNTALQKPYSEGHGGPGLSGVIGLSWDDLVETCLGEVTCGEGPSFLGLGSEHCQVPSSLFLCRECVCLSTVSWTHRGLKGKHCYRPPPPPSSHRLVWNVISYRAAAQYMWSEQTGKENAVIVSVSSLLLPSGLPALLSRGGRQGLGAGTGRGWRDRMHLAHWTDRGSLQPLKGSSSFSTIKLYFSYQKFGLIYTYTNIYISTFLSIQCFYYTRNPAAPTYTFLVNFIWLKHTRARTHAHRGEGCFGV